MRKVKNPAKKNTSAWRKRERQKQYRAYQNIIHNNVKSTMRFMYIHATRAQRAKVLPILKDTLRAMTQHKSYVPTKEAQRKLA